jgi:hypothetical protein
MKPSTIDMLRAYLLTASLAAAFLEVLVLIGHLLFGISEAAFLSVSFRLGVAVVIVCIVLATKRIAHGAFRSAVSNRYATCGGARSEAVYISPECPVRALVILHLRFNRRLFDLVEG